MPTHRRQDSSDEPKPAEAAPETRNPTSESDAPDSTTPTPQDLPRGSRDLGANAPPGHAPAVNAARGLTNDPSARSTHSDANPSHEYPTAPVPGPVHPSAGTQPPSLAAKRSPEPPVTKQALRDLDVNKFVHDLRLRHDINFELELQMWPVLDSDMGRRKQEKAREFWPMLREQLVMFVTDRDAFQRNYGDGDWCLPSLLTAVREILETLVPLRDRTLLRQGLNVDLLMQQFSHGVADLEKLASWLAAYLKRHCAPMRDEWVDDMYHDLSSGNRNNDMAQLVRGMRSLLSLLEAMKLDVANHQIRCLRRMLIQDTVRFEQRYFLTRMESGRCIAASRDWYTAAQEYVGRLYAGSPSPHVHAFGEMTVFFEALSRLVLPSTPKCDVPPSLILDEDRMLKLRSDMHDSICLEICMRKYEDLERLSRLTQRPQRVPSYVCDERAASNRFSGEFNLLAPGTSRPSSFAFSDRGSNSSSPRTSGLFAHAPRDVAESRPKATDVYNSLVALLHSASSEGIPHRRSDNAPVPSPAERWRSLSDAMALQILRYANAPFPLPDFERQLTACLSDVGSDVFREMERQFHQRLLAQLAKRVSEFKHLSGPALANAAARGRVQGSNRLGQRTIDPFGDLGAAPRDPREGGIDDMAIRLAHLGVLHWRVWGPLAYEGDIDGLLHELDARAQQPPMI